MPIRTASANSMGSDLRCTAKIYFDNVTLMLQNVTRPLVQKSLYILYLYRTLRFYTRPEFENACAIGSLV